MRAIDTIIIHCSATKPTQDIGAEVIRGWHVKDRGWKDIGYHYVIRRNGLVELGRDLDGDGDVDEEVGAHAAGFNSNSIGICMVGGIDAAGKPDSNFTIAQWRTLGDVLAALRAKYPRTRIIGHRNVEPGKACPSFDATVLL